MNPIKLIVYIFVLIFFSCSKEIPSPSSPNDTDLNPNVISHKEYTLDSFGNIVDTEIEITDFTSADNCKSCHLDHFNEWNSSFHAFSFSDPIFMSMWSSEKNNHPETGTMYCIQCHAPAAFVTGYSFVEPLEFDNIPKIIKEGVSCDICHTMVQKSPTVHTQDDVAAIAEYYLNPGENVKYGSIQNPDCNSDTTTVGYHTECQYLPLFKSSSSCKPCHDQSIRGMPIETTVSEWDAHPGLSMGGPSCQDCHMPKNDSHSSHYFAGVDLLFYDGVDENSQQYKEVINLLEQAASINLGYLNTVQDSIYIENNVLYLPITINNLTGHKLPSGTPFSREVWVEIKVTLNGNIIFEKGILDNPLSLIDYDDPDIILYTTVLYDEEGYIIYEPSNTFSYDDRTLGTLLYDSRIYEIEVDDLEGELIVEARMLFRPFKPQMLKQFHPSSMSNLYIIPMCSDIVSVIIQ